MDETELLEVIARGEDSKHQFKANVTNPVALASEMVAFANAEGGFLLALMMTALLAVFHKMI